MRRRSAGGRDRRRADRAGGGRAPAGPRAGAAGAGGRAVGGDAVRRVASRAAVLPVGGAGRPGRGEAAGPDRLGRAGPGQVPDRARSGPSSTCSRWPTRSATGCATAPGSSGWPAGAATVSSTPAATTEPLTVHVDDRRPGRSGSPLAPSSTPPAPGRPPNPLGADGCRRSGEPAAADRIAYRVPDLDRPRRAGPVRGQAGRGRRLRALRADRAGRVRRARRAAPGHPRGVAAASRARSATPSAAATPTSSRRAARSGSGAARAVAAGHIRTVTGSAPPRSTAQTDGRLVLESVDGRRLDPVDEVVVVTGFRPDLSFLSEVRLDLDPVLQAPRALAPLIDPNVHSCGTVYPHGAAELAQPEPGVFLVGMKSYGRAPTFLAMTGYEQVRSVAAALAGDHEAAERVELVLPETGVCGGGGLFDETADQPRRRRAAAAARPSRWTWRRRRSASAAGSRGTLSRCRRDGAPRGGGGRVRNAERVRAPPRARGPVRAPRSSAGACCTTPSRSSPRPSPRDTGWSIAATTAAFSTGLVVSALVGIPVGRLLDRIGPRPVMTAGSMLAVPAVLGIATAPSLPCVLRRLGRWPASPWPARSTRRRSPR